MENFATFVIIILGVITPIFLITFRLIFKKSLVFRIVAVIIFLIDVISILSFLNGAGTDTKDMIWMGPLGSSLIVVGFFIIIRSVKKLSVLTAKIEVVAAGDFNVEIDNSIIKRNDEIGSVAKALRLMLKDYKKNISIMTKVSQGEIESAKKIIKENKIKNDFDKSINEMVNDYLKNMNIVTKVSQGDIVSAKEIISNNKLRTDFDKSINEMVNDISNSIEIAKNTANGKLHEISTLVNKDHKLNFALYKMQEKLNNIVNQIRISSFQITDAGEQLSSISEQLAQRANEQAATTEEIASSMEEIFSTIAENTKNAQITNEIVNEAAENIKSGNKVFEKTVKQVFKITEKTNIISEIAEKTDVLAINAAIEATKSRKNGKGFGVVAKEIRKLAESSKVASKEISKITKRSMKIAVNAGKELKHTVPKIVESSELVRSISNSSKEQETSLQFVNNSIQQLTSITNGNSAAAEEMSSSAEELSAQAVQLNNLISFFKTKPNINKQNNFLNKVRTEQKEEKFESKGFILKFDNENEEKDSIKDIEYENY